MSTSAEPGSIDQSDERGIRWEKELEEEAKEDVMNAVFSRYEGTHKDHSCVGVGSSEDGRYLVKEKDRNYATEQTEFDSLRIWNNVLESYDEGCGTGIRSPTPYCHTEKEGVVMELIDGDDWAPMDYVHSDGQGPQIIDGRDEAKRVSKRVGALAKIMENEGLHHGDIAERHLLINKHNQELGVIDVEGISRAETEQEVQEEVRQLRETLDHVKRAKAYDNDEVDAWFEEGYNSVSDEPQSNFLDSYGFGGFEEGYDFEKLRNSIGVVFD